MTLNEFTLKADNCIFSSYRASDLVATVEDSTDKDKSALLLRWEYLEGRWGDSEFMESVAEGDSSEYDEFDEFGDHFDEVILLRTLVGQK